MASPVPLRFNQGQMPATDHPATDPGRETPLPQYEKTQSVPFSLNLQEDARNPGQFQLVVNINSNYPSSAGIPLSLAPPASGLLPADQASKLGSDAPQLYQTQKSSPSTTPLQEKQG